MNHTLNKVRDGGVTKILNMICDVPGYKDYRYFSTSKTFGDERKDDGLYDSLEGLHNEYHNNIGGSGHMSQVPVAAFDPVFWMHHA